ncbi:MAG TPA: hypothetical protein VHO25_05360, partial [Polyangiaceae bacterium]|nr:hypothetical protein [Polyangiaceae bacterium]
AATIPPMLSPLVKKQLLAVIFAFAFIINPAYLVACNSEADDNEPNFGEAEMVGLLDDFNGMDATVVDEGDAVYEVNLALTQREGTDAVSSRGGRPRSSQGAGVIRAAHACGSRTFLKSAAACITETILEVEGTAIVRRVDGATPVTVVEDLAVQGQIVATGETLSFASLDLTFAGGYAGWGTDDGEHFELSAFDATDLGPEAVDISYHTPL